MLFKLYTVEGILSLILYRHKTITRTDAELLSTKPSKSNLSSDGDGYYGSGS